MNISGETIDYGPCAFMDEFSANKVFSSIDMNGRYAYRNQPGIAQWNMAVLAQCLLASMDKDQDAAVAKAQKIIDAFPAVYESYYQAGMCRKLGVEWTASQSDKQKQVSGLIKELLELMENGRADFTLTFRQLGDVATANIGCLLYTSPSPRDLSTSRMPSSA